MSTFRLILFVSIALMATSVPAASPPSKCRRRILPRDVRFCCFKFGIGCIQKGRRCTVTNLIGTIVPCSKDLTCVLSDFGEPAGGEESVGKCLDLPRKPKKCTIERCSATGQKTICTISRVAATCGAWATRRDAGPRPDCPAFCTKLLQIPQPKGSDGKLYGNNGCLVVASCESDFEIYGPVPRSPKDICKKPIGSLLKNRCCIDYGIECARKGEVCASSPGDSFRGPKECMKGLTCVISDLGDGEFDFPEGTCERLRGTLRKCMTKSCSKNGPDYICKIPKSENVSTCKTWSQSLEWESSYPAASRCSAVTSFLR